MSIDFTPLDVRAGGLRAHLFPRAELEALAALGDAPALVAALADSARIAPALATDADLGQAEAAVRRTSARHLRVLARWCADRPAALGVFEAELDRRSIRAMLRGAVQGAAAQARLAGLIPTQALGEPMLSQLAHLGTPREVLAHLFASGHPYAARLLPCASGVQVDLAELELALIHAGSQRMSACARAADRPLRDYVRLRIDFENAQTALLLAGGTHDLDAKACFVEGGRHLDRAAFEAAAAAPAQACLAFLRQALNGSPLGALFRGPSVQAAALEARALACLIGAYRRAARVDPLSSAPLVLFMLRLQAQGMDLMRIIHGAALGVPPPMLREGLVTPWN